jgi:hypothetical protein
MQALPGSPGDRLGGEATSVRRCCARADNQLPNHPSKFCDKPCRRSGLGEGDEVGVAPPNSVREGSAGINDRRHLAGGQRLQQGRSRAVGEIKIENSNIDLYSAPYELSRLSSCRDRANDIGVGLFQHLGDMSATKRSSSTTSTRTPLSITHLQKSSGERPPSAKVPFLTAEANRFEVPAASECLLPSTEGGAET